MTMSTLNFIVIGVMLAFVMIVIGIDALRGWLHRNKLAILREARRQRRIKMAVNQYWRERRATALAPLDEALAHANATLARVQLTTKERLDSTYSIINKRKEG